MFKKGPVGLELWISRQRCWEKSGELGVSLSKKKNIEKNIRRCRNVIHRSNQNICFVKSEGTNIAKLLILFKIISEFAQKT